MDMVELERPEQQAFGAQLDWLCHRPISDSRVGRNHTLGHLPQAPEARSDALEGSFMRLKPFRRIGPMPVGQHISFYRSPADSGGSFDALYLSSNSR